MPLDTSDMTPQEARDHIARLSISQQALARILRVNPVTVRRWLKLDGTALDIPRAVQLLLRLLTPAQARRLVEIDQKAD
ncbi:MAG TPA: hypothetical protein VNZ53_42875 [Steroidobacteraceae bacterium]|jgi:DNA-binding transcriptional regulator YiaG|nr:hypothetical protein [Steroidobacteraceae bacterium]